MASLSKVRDRERLKRRREPYWERIRDGAYLGFRKGQKADTWRARYRNADESQSYHALPGVTEFPPNQQYDIAKRLAEDWFEQMGSPATHKAVRSSVRTALDAYLEYLRKQGREDTARNAENNHFKVVVWNDPIATKKLEDLTRAEFREWRERLRVGRKNRTVNRHVRAVVAGLNHSVKEGHSGNPEAWRIEPLADDKEDNGETIVFLSNEQRSAIINAASPACANLLQALAHTGARPGELAAVTVADLDKKGATLTLRHKKGRPPRLRARAVVLADDALVFFKRMARGKKAKTPLLLDPNGEPWGRHKWADEVQAAIAAVNGKAKGDKQIPKGTSAYSFRHARISELLQDYGVDPLTVAQQTGTSVRMIEQSYFKFIGSALREKLSAIGK